MYQKFNKTQSLHKDQSVFLIKSEVTSVMVDNLTIYKQILSESLLYIIIDMWVVLLTANQMLESVHLTESLLSTLLQFNNN